MLNRIHKLLAKLKRLKKELVSYLIFGVLTTILNVGLFQLLIIYQIDYKIANLIALISAKTFAYLTNKIFVFKSKTPKVHQTLGELLRFGIARGFTGILDYFGLIMLVEVLLFDPVISKWSIQVIVIILNYLMGKKLVFRKQSTY
ncbi:MAG: GtrA family protein [Eubacteriales bacterium]|nr:GtrA family protein [Eubacteriales bacterium]